MAKHILGFQRFLDEGLFSDLILVIGSKKIHCHQLILAHTSTVLRERILSASSKDLLSKTIDLTAEIDSNLTKTFQSVVLPYFYSCNVKITLKNFTQLHCIADVLGMNDLIESTRAFMTQNVTRETVIDVLDDVIECRTSAVISHVVTVIAQNFSDFFENPKFDWQSLSLAMMLDLVHSPALLSASEAHVFLALEKFLAKYKKLDPLSEKQLASLFETVRFEKLDFATLEAALNHPMVPKSLLSHALMLKLAKFEKPNEAAAAQVQKSSSPLTKARRPSYGRLLQYTSDFDNKGVLYYIGTQAYRAPWQNPMLAKFGVVVQFSSLEKGQAHLVLDRDAKEIWTQDVPSSWFQVDIGEGRAVKLSAYTLRHGSSMRQDFLRTWVLKGSNDGVEWDTIRRHKDDDSLNNSNFCSYTWKIFSADSNRAYRLFRVTQTGHNSTKHNFLCVSGLELYGELIFSAMK